MYNYEYIKAKISLYNANLYGNKVPKENESCTLLLDSIVNVDEKYYLQILLKKNANKKEQDNKFY